MQSQFSIIIPTLNEEHHIGKLLTALANQTFRSFEVVISDSGSTDGTEKLVETFRPKLPALAFLKHPEKNVSAARNNAARHSKNEWLVFFDADVVPSADFLHGIADRIGSNQLDALTVWNRPLDAHLGGYIILALLNASMSIVQYFKPAANGPCIIMRRDMYDKLKGFDDTIFFGEDYDIIKRGHKTGMRFAVFPEPRLQVSTRRIEKEGLCLTLRKSLTALIYQETKGPIRHKIFEYEMGGQYFRKSGK